mgnify:CR=1 FL=1
MVLSNAGLDMAVRWGKGNWDRPGITVDKVFRCPALLTCNVAIGRYIEARGLGVVVSEQDLLHDRDDSPAWRDWFEADGLDWVPSSNHLVIPDPNVRAQAVMDGQA